MSRFADLLKRHAKITLSVLAIVGIIAFGRFLQIPSEAENQILFGLSFKRIVLGLIIASVLAFNVGLVFWMPLRTDGRRTIGSRLFTWVTDRAALTMLMLYVLCLVVGVLVFFVFHPFKKGFQMMESIRTLVGMAVIWSFLLSLYLLVFFRISYSDQLSNSRLIVIVERFLLLVGIFGITYLSYQHLLIGIGAEKQLSYKYWNLLADAFLKGRLYLNDPSQTHDLTLYQGKWYVAAPPLPAIMMMPLAYLIGGENINTSYFSIFLSAINALFVFLILEELVKRGWIQRSRVGILLLVVLFAFSTPHLWVGIRGRFWFVSQIATVFFLALAVLLTLRSWSPWLVGLCIGLAVMSRPNGALTWPFVLAIAMQILKEERGSINIRDLISWSIKSAIPVGMGVAALLLYNFARFGNPLDFGYVTISGDPEIVQNAKTYGMFSLHYIPVNLKAMFLYFPTIQLGSQWPILPSTMGMSVFLATPPLLYLFHRYERQWWILGAWASVVLNFLLLVLYHNTGAHQFGYRYILDAIVPLLALLAVALGRKTPWHFVLLLLVSILFNIYGAYWYING